MRVASVAQAEALEFIKNEYGQEYAPDTPNEYKSRKTSQDAHEAIRPTSVARTPESIKPYLTRDQYRLYKLIWERFLASQMTPAIFDTVSVEIEAGDYGIRASSSQIKFMGYKKYMMIQKKKRLKNPIPDVTEGEALALVELKPEQHFTQPPPRYTEAGLVKILEEKEYRQTQYLCSPHY